MLGTTDDSVWVALRMNVFFDGWLFDQVPGGLSAHVMDDQIVGPSVYAMSQHCDH